MTDNVAAFLSFHGFNVDDWPWGRELLAAFLAGRDGLTKSLATVPDSVIDKEPSFGLLYQLSERASEHIAGAIACFATKNAASAEVVARAAFETCVNIRFMLLGDRNSRVVAWIRDYVHSDRKQIDQWEKSLAGVAEEERRFSIPRIVARRKVHELRTKWLQSAEAEFAQFGPLNLDEPWPKIIGRFEQIGEAVAYRTVYARLSSQTHADAEDTLNYIVFSGDQALHAQMAQETTAFSQYLIAHSAYFYLLTMAGFSKIFQVRIPAELHASIGTVFDRMNELAEIWKW
jgi:hypothetical protein